MNEYLQGKQILEPTGTNSGQLVNKYILITFPIRSSMVVRGTVHVKEKRVISQLLMFPCSYWEGRQRGTALSLGTISWHLRQAWRRPRWEREAWVESSPDLHQSVLSRQKGGGPGWVTGDGLWEQSPWEAVASAFLDSMMSDINLETVSCPLPFRIKAPNFRKVAYKILCKWVFEDGWHLGWGSREEGHQMNHGQARGGVNGSVTWEQNGAHPPVAGWTVGPEDVPEVCE